MNDMSSFFSDAGDNKATSAPIRGMELACSHYYHFKQPIDLGNSYTKLNFLTRKEKKCGDAW